MSKTKVSGRTVQTGEHKHTDKAMDGHYQMYYDLSPLLCDRLLNRNLGLALQNHIHSLRRPRSHRVTSSISRDYGEIVISEAI